MNGTWAFNEYLDNDAVGHGLMNKKGPEYP